MTLLEQHQKLFNMLLDIKDFADNQGIQIDLDSQMQDTSLMINLLMKLSITNDTAEVTRLNLV